LSHIYLNNKSFSYDKLPSEPSLLIELLKLNHDNNADFAMFAQAVRKDIGLTAKIIQVVSSPAYRQWNAVDSVERMLIVLGLSTARRIVISAAIQQFFASLTNDFSRPIQQIWFRSLLCANLSERLANLVGYDKREEAFLTGLLHQIGMLLLLLNYEQEYLPLLESYYSESENFHQLEQQRFDVNHCQLGAALVQNWNLDSFTADALHFQRAATEELITAPTLLKILAVAAPLSSSNKARSNHKYLERGSRLFDLTEASLIDCLNEATEQSKTMIADLGFRDNFYISDDERYYDCTNHNDHNAKELSRHIKNIALSKTALDANVADLSDFSSSVRSCFSSLFNHHKLCIFKLNPETNQLTPIDDLQQKKLNEIQLYHQNGDYQIGKAFSNNEICLFTNDGTGSIGEIQLARILNCPKLLYVPLQCAGITFGIIAIGLHETFCDTKKPLLRLLAQEIATQLSTLQQPKEEQMSVSEFRHFVHEINNPLTIINNYLYILGIKLESENNTLEELDIIRAEIERVGNLLLHARNPENEPKNQDKTNINKLITDLDQLLRGSLYKTSEIKSQLQLDKSVPQINCNTDKLKQILINLLKNAVEAMPNGGSIHITTRDNIYQHNRSHIQITIKDNGPGICDAVLANLFKPVTSTKDGHSGLGLAIINNLATELNASISCYSKANQGTEFSILIPRTL
jgi:HD-like signal output (HDOD) protein/nitrogen-specific signal transduction histidine kinase